MHVDRHQEIRHIIDRSLVGASSQEEQTLREHLVTCVACQEYLKASHQVIAGQKGFSFEGESRSSWEECSPPLRYAHNNWKPRGCSKGRCCGVTWPCSTLAGSFTAARFSGLAGAVFHIEPEPLHIGLLALWIVPSLCFCLLFPVLHRLSLGGTNEKGLTQ